jgi:hypothetical protein
MSAYIGVVIDGHTIRAFNGELVKRNGIIYSIVSWITTNCGIAITDYIKAHWEQQCGTRAKNPLFWEWYFDQLYNKEAIHFVEVTRLQSNAWRAIRATYGSPNDPFVRSAIECANSTISPRYILAEDMDFHDPKAKRLPTPTQVEIKERGIGRLRLYLRDNLKILVGTLSNCRAHFSIDNGACPNKPTDCSKQCPCSP